MNTTNITVNTQSSIRIDGSKVLYFDPFQIASETHDADIIFITHSHYDHLDPESVSKVSKTDTVFIAPDSMEQEIRKAAGDAELILMEPGATREVSGISVKSVPAYNRLKPFHPKRNGWCGYVVTMVKCNVAMVPIGGTYTMNAKDAAKLINQIRPEVAIPTHYGSIVGKSEDADTFRKFVDQAIVVETRL